MTSRPTVPTAVRADRAVGVVAATAAGDALGAGYEFGPPLPTDAEVAMIGGGQGFAPGEWTDDTQMTVAVLTELATGSTDVEAIGEAFRAWAARGPSDVGIQTSRILATRGPLVEAATAHFEANPRNAAGNGSLMRTGPVALAHPGDRTAIAALARQVSDLTHGDPTCGDACVLWSLAIDRTVDWTPEDGEPWNAADAVRAGLDLIPEARREKWRALIDEAEVSEPEAFPKNGWVIHAFQAALAAICRTPVPDEDPARHLRLVLERAVRVGLDTDTVAAIAGALIGARWGATAIPFEWRRAIHGQGVQAQPVMRLADLERMARLAAGGGEPGAQGWPSCRSMLGHYERAWPAPPVRATVEGVEFGNVHALADALEDGTDVVVSLCRMGTGDVPDEVEHHVLGLLDTTAEENPNLTYLLAEVVGGIEQMVAEGRRVFVHCVQAQNRTPTVAAAWLAHRTGTSADEALDQVAQTLDRPKPFLAEAVRDLAARSQR